MNDTVFYTIDAILGSLRGLLFKKRREQIAKRYGMAPEQFPASAKIFSTPTGQIPASLLAAYILNKEMSTYAKNGASAKTINQ